MADHYSGNINIPKAFINPKIQAELDKERLKPAGEKDDIVLFSDDEATNGQFDSLEFELVEAGVAFDGHSDGYCDISPESRYFRPGTDSADEIDITVLEDRELGEFIPVYEIKPFLDLPADEFKGKMLSLVEKYNPSVQPLSEWAATKFDGCSDN